MTPVTEFIPPTRRQARRHGRSHPYFTKRASNVVAEYIKAFTSKYDTVLDPFCGSGVTPVEALVLRRRAVASDLLPWACWITKMKCVAPVDLESLDRAFEKVKSRCKPVIDRLYLLPDIEAMNLSPEYWYPTDPMPEWVDQHHLGTIDKLFSPRQLTSLALLLHVINHEIDAAPINRELLKFTFSGMLARASLTYWTTNREYEGEYSGNSGIFTKFRYWMPRNPTDLNVWRSFENRYKWVRNAKQETNNLIGRFYDNGTCIIHPSSAEDIGTWVKENSVDYVFADPPYGRNIAYADLSALWQAWLRFPVPDSHKEMIEAGNLGKTRSDYLTRLAASFEAIYRVLRRNRWFSLVYVHKDPTLWNAVLTACRDAGFKYEGGVPQPTSLVAFHKVRNRLRTISGEMIINFSKPVRMAAPKRAAAITLPALEHYMVKEAGRVIIRYLGADIDVINFHIVSKLLDLNGGVLGDSQLFAEARERTKDLPTFLSRYFRAGPDNCWYLKDDDPGDPLLGVRANLRYFVFQRLQSGPSTIDDVHYYVLAKFAQGNWDGGNELSNSLPDVLSELAIERDGYWHLRERVAKQLFLPIDPIPKDERPRRPQAQRNIVEEDPEYEAILAQMAPEERTLVLGFAGVIKPNYEVDLGLVEGEEWYED